MYFWPWNNLRTPRCLSWLCLLFILILLTGCETRVVSRTWENFFPKKGTSNRDVMQKSSNLLEYLPHQNRAWAVQVAAFSGPKRAIHAASLMGILKKQFHFQDIWLYDQHGVLSVLVGKFNKRSSDLKHTLTQVRIAQNKKGQNVFARARVVSMITGGKSYSNPWNLRVYHKEYTLQIGFYEGENQKQNAQNAVKSLRKRGVNAFYYLDKARSIVTVGLFTQQRAFVTKRAKISPGKSWVQAYSPAVRALQKHFPYNLGNGKTVKQSYKGKNLGAQRSFLVQTP